MKIYCPECGSTKNKEGYVLFHINEWESLLDQLATVA